MRVVQAVRDRGFPVVAAVLGLIVAILELTLFNLPHWTSLAAGEEIVASPANIGVVGVRMDYDSGLLEMYEPHGRIEVTGYDTKLRTIWIDPVFHDNAQQQPITIYYDDEGAANRNGGTYNLVAGVEQNNYLLLETMGQSDRVAVEFNSDQSVAGIRQIILNKTIPLGFNWLRFGLLWLLAAFAYLLISRKLWRVTVDPAARSQRISNAVMVAAMVGTLGAAVVWSVSWADGWAAGFRQLLTADHHEYAQLIDAFFKGQVSLLAQPDPSLLSAEYPYDPTYRDDHGVIYLWDYAFWDGQYYSAQGIVPAVVMFLPYRILTGVHLATPLAGFIAAAAAAWFFYLIWRRIVLRWFPQLPYVLYVLGALALFAGSQLVYIMAGPGLQEVVLASGAACVGFGLWALLRATENDKVHLRWVGAGALGLALAVGCRPDLLFVSLLLPVLLWPYLPRKNDGHGRHVAGIAAPPAPIDWPGLLRPNFARLVLACAIPYAVVLGALMVYNAVRFGSVSEFGTTYQLTVANVAGYTDRGVTGTVVTAAYGLFAYLFTGLTLHQVFPFVTADMPWSLPGYTGYLAVSRTVGAVFLPLLWLLPVGGLLGPQFRRRPSLKPLIGAMAGVGLILAVVLTISHGVVGRYETDFFWLWLLPALAILATAHERAVEVGLTPGKVTAVSAALLLVTIGFGLNVG
ncbi:MAG: hypothetical protein LBL92_06385, partial [Propionibacteriaceae bacterium]|nr:hypothetical protein [Propionibacteriaceae bacterium]